MATEVDLANSVPVASRVQVALGIDEPIEVFLKRYTATAQTDDVLVFLSTARRPPMRPSRWPTPCPRSSSPTGRSRTPKRWTSCGRR